MSPQAQPPKARNWFGTINDTAENPLPTWTKLPDNCRYFVGQREQGSHLHLHFFVQFETAIRLTTVLKRLSIPKGKGETVVPAQSPKDSQHYVSKPHAGCDCIHCTKERTKNTKIDGSHWEFGTAIFQGQQTRAEVLELVRTQGYAAAAIAEPAAISHFYRFAQHYESLLRTQERRKAGWLQMCVIVLNGPSGVGKSRTAIERYPNLYEVFSHDKNSGFWMDGYAGEKEVLFEEFLAQIDLGYLLRLLDGFATRRVPTKGSSFPWCATTVIFTSNQDFQLWYRRYPEVQRQALFRRVYEQGAHFRWDQTTSGNWYRVKSAQDSHLRINDIWEDREMPQANRSAESQRSCLTCSSPVLIGNYCNRTCETNFIQQLGASRQRVAETESASIASDVSRVSDLLGQPGTTSSTGPSPL